MDNKQIQKEISRQELNNRIELYKAKYGLTKDSFLRTCLVCYNVWRIGFDCPTKDCTQHRWTIDYNNYVQEDKE